jgi:hypothetical protein
MLSTLSRRLVARGLRPSPLALHRVRMCQSAAAQPEVKVTIEGPAAARSDDETAEVALEKALRPKEIVEQLDRYIIGQPEAKRAVAVAMRNRWRRQRVASPLKEEVCRRAPSCPYRAPYRPCPPPARHASMRAPDGARTCPFPADLAEEHLDDRPDWQGRAPQTWATPRSLPAGRPAQARPKARPRHGPGPGTGPGTGVARPRHGRARVQWFRAAALHGWPRARWHTSRPAPHAARRTCAGCGKTEVARRLAKLAQAPFIKVEPIKSNPCPCPYPYPYH